MTPAQKETFHIIEKYWADFGFGPTIDDIMRMTGEKGRGNVARKMRLLIKLGICKGDTRLTRSIRPSYLKFRSLRG
jgi:SOS-response transcriptional repressor LexA